MSLESQTNVQCPKCGDNQAVTVWRSLNADVSPEAREDLLAGRINVFDCAKCECKAGLGVPLLYHDMRRQFLVQFHPFEALDDPDLLIDIADWESPEARTTHLAEAMAAGAYGPVIELLAGPFRATVIRRLP